MDPARWYLHGGSLIRFRRAPVHLRKYGEDIEKTRIYIKKAG